MTWDELKRRLDADEHLDPTKIADIVNGARELILSEGPRPQSWTSILSKLHPVLSEARYIRSKSSDQSLVEAVQRLNQKRP